jgi:hypothetical protein
MNRRINFPSRISDAECARYFNVNAWLFYGKERRGSALDVVKPTVDFLDISRGLMDCGLKLDVHGQFEGSKIFLSLLVRVE